MKDIFKHIIAFLFILLFIFPSVAETFHQYQHKEDVHCRDFSTLHFHTGEHHCSLCDYVPIAADGSFISFTIPSPFVLAIDYAASLAEPPVAANTFTLSLRGPPVC